MARGNKVRVDERAFRTKHAPEPEPTFLERYNGHDIFGVVRGGRPTYYAQHATTRARSRVMSLTMCKTFIDLYWVRP